MNQEDGSLLDRISQVLDENDPHDLIEMATSNGFAYEDVAGEYETEAKAILSRQDEWSSVDQLQHVIKDIFDRFFYFPNISDERYKKTAQDIWNTWLVHLGETPESFANDQVLPPRTKPVVIILD